jgi:putative ABC transport system permease protein
VRGLMARVRSLLRGVRGGDALDQEMDEEFRHHMELRAADLVRRGLSPTEAARRARLEFGSTETYKDAGRESRGLHRFDQLRVSMLDFKLGARMLVKYPGLTLVGGLAIAFAIAVGSGAFEVIRQMAAPSLPLPDGGRIVAIVQADVSAGRSSDATTRDVLTWGRELASLEHFGAFRSHDRNLSTGSGAGEPVVVAEIGASAFPLTRIAPLLGRVLVAADERPDAPDVVVIGYHVWRNRFDGDSHVVGRSVDVGGVPSTIVGVMPEGYAFPMYHNAWIPLRLAAAASESQLAIPVEGTFARLAPGRSKREAQAELTRLGERTAADFPDTHRHLRPRIVRYAETFLQLDPTELAVMWSMNVLVGMLLVLVCGNVALLMFARAATRQTEIVVRSALGAGRGRIVIQLFSEALVLVAIAAAVGLTASRFAMQWVRVVMGANTSDLPFWFTLELSPLSYVYAAALALMAAVIAGVVPALKITAGGVEARVREMTSGGGGLKFGGIWTVIIIAQVAITVVFPVVAYFTHRDAQQFEATPAGFPAQEYLAAGLQMDRDSRVTSVDTSARVFRSRFAARYHDLSARLAAEPGVRAVTYGARLPLMYHPHRIISIDSGPAAPINPEWPDGYRVSSVHVDPRFFEVLGVPIVKGRAFSVADADTTQRFVIVNEAFVLRVMGGHNPIGRRLRFTYFEGQVRRADREPGPWFEIVGVARNIGVMPDTYDPKVARIYHAALPESMHPLQLAIHVPAGPQRFAQRLRELVAEVDPALRLDAPLRLDRVIEPELQFMGMWFRILLAVSALALGLSLAGIYAVMAFAVSKRTREIGVRVALGATPRSVIVAVFARPLTHVLLGIGAGTILTGGLLFSASGGGFSVKGAGLLTAYAIFMVAVCLLACVVPTRRALRVQPTDALKAEG